MHGSWGNAIEAADAFDRMGPTSCAGSSAQPFDWNLPSATAGARDQAQAAHACTPVRFFVDYANIAGFQPSYGDLGLWPGDGRRRPLAGGPHLPARARGDEVRVLSRRARARRVRGVLDDLSNWYIRRSRRRFLGRRRGRATRLVGARPVDARTVPTTPFLAEHLWLNLVAGAADDASDSASSPAGRAGRARLEAARRGGGRPPCRRASAPSARSLGLLRQPLRRLVVQGASSPRVTGTRSRTSSA